MGLRKKRSLFWPSQIWLYNERITPNKLTIQREDGSKVTIGATDNTA